MFQTTQKRQAGFPILKKRYCDYHYDESLSPVLCSVYIYWLSIYSNNKHLNSNIGKGLTIHIHECMLSHFSHVRLFVTLYIVAHQAPLSMGFSRQEYWKGLPGMPMPFSRVSYGSRDGNHFPMSPALAGKLFTTSAT